jgi:AraC-like DNA-binding protein
LTSKDFIPAEDLRGYVQLYRIIHLQFNKGAAPPFKAYPPRPEHCIAFYPYDTETVEFADGQPTKSKLPVVLYGQFSAVTKRHIGTNFLVVQIIFLPGAFYRLTGIPANCITNQYTDARLLLGNQLNLVNEQLFYAKDYKAMIEIVNTFVRSLLRNIQQPPHPIENAFKMMLYGNRQYTLQSIASQACLGLRQFERKCKIYTGVNPKLYARIIRFDNAFRLKNTQPKMDWLSVAVQTDCHDYQHLVKEYKDFTGLSPQQFHQIENNAPERTFGLSEVFYNSKLNE